MALEHLQAVLFDLDGTLLDNDLDVFLPRYLKLLAAAMADVLPPKQFIAELMAATRVMETNDGRGTNEDVFAEVFYPAIGRSRAEMEPRFLDFYQNEYGTLQPLTGRRPEARHAVQAAFDRGCQVVIATNPLFPGIAQNQRVGWAGVAGLPYSQVTSYENSRACKPNLLYYRDIINALGVPPEACLMVGNDDVDMAAGLLGCATFLVTDATEVKVGPGVPPPTASGPLASLVALLRNGH